MKVGDLVTRVFEDPDLAARMRDSCRVGIIVGHRFVRYSRKIVYTVRWADGAMFNYIEEELRVLVSA